MAKHYTIARPYARAVFQQALADDCLAQWSTVLQGLAFVTSDARMVSLYGDPRLTEALMMTLVCETLSDVVHEAVDTLGDKLKNFLSLLLEEKRLPITNDINVLYHRLLADHKNIIEVDVISAMTLGEEQRQAFYTSLEKRFASKVSIAFQEDDTLLGGAVVRSGNWVLDGSIRGKLTRLDDILMR